MNPEIVYTRSARETQKLGERVGKSLQADTIVTLSGDLGCGKTTFTQGLAKGLSVPSEYYVTSPSYSIINEYPGRYPLYHVDLYRIGDLSELDDIGFDEILDSGGITVIEWAEKLGRDYVNPDIRVSIRYINADEREVVIQKQT